MAHNHIKKGWGMSSIEEAVVPANRKIDTQALGALIDNDGLAVEVAGADDITRRLLDLARYQHLVLVEIFELSDPHSKTPLLGMDSIRFKSHAALREAARSGLLS